MKSCLFFLILEMCIISCYSNILVKPVSLLYFQKKIPWREFPVLFIILDSKKLLLIISEQCFAKQEFSETFKSTLFLKHSQVTTSKEMQHL